MESLRPSMGLSINSLQCDRSSGHPYSNWTCSNSGSQLCHVPSWYAYCRLAVAGGENQEERILRVAQAWESHFDWTKVQLSAHEN